MHYIFFIISVNNFNIHISLRKVFLLSFKIFINWLSPYHMN